jgi:hypothetical protein
VVRLAGLLAAEVLEQKRNAAERTVRQGTRRVAAGPLELAMDHAVELPVDAFDPGDRGVDELDRLHLVAPHQVGERSRVQIAERVRHRSDGSGPDADGRPAKCSSRDRVRGGSVRGHGVSAARGRR